jgi:hypothetical protein
MRESLVDFIDEKTFDDDIAGCGLGGCGGQILGSRKSLYHCLLFWVGHLPGIAALGAQRGRFEDARRPRFCSLQGIANLKHVFCLCRTCSTKSQS